VLFFDFTETKVLAGFDEVFMLDISDIFQIRVKLKQEFDLRILVAMDPANDGAIQNTRKEITTLNSIWLPHIFLICQHTFCLWD
jgi:hypothetical protein